MMKRDRWTRAIIPLPFLFKVPSRELVHFMTAKSRKLFN